MVWRAAVDGEARILLRGASAGVYRWRVLFLLPQRCALSGGLVGPRSCRSAAAGFWDPLDWVCDHFYSSSPPSVVYFGRAPRVSIIRLAACKTLANALVGPNWL